MQTRHVNFFSSCIGGLKPPLVHVGASPGQQVSFDQEFGLVLRLTPSKWSSCHKSNAHHFLHRSSWRCLHYGDSHEAGVSSSPEQSLTPPLHTKPEGRATKISRGRHTKITRVVQSRTIHKATTPYSLTLSRSNLQITLSKHVLKPMMWSISSMDGLEIFFSGYVLLLNSSRLKWHGATPYIG
jgi:hypothetical protein